MEVVESEQGEEKIGEERLRFSSMLVYTVLSCALLLRYGPMAK